MGTPERCLARLRALSDAFHPEQFLLVFEYGFIPVEIAETSLRLFARAVLPTAQDIPVLEPIAYESAAVS